MCGMNDVSFFDTIQQCLKRSKNGLPIKEIYDCVDSKIETKGKWWQKTVRNSLKRHNEFILVDKKWRLR